MFVKSLLTFHFLDETADQIGPVLETARNMDAHLDIVVVGIEMAPPADIHGGFPSEYWQEYNTKLTADVEKRQTELEEFIGKSSAAASVSCETVELSAINQLVRPHILCADLTLLGRKQLAQSTAAERTLSAALFDTGRPVLIHCDTAFDKEALETIIIGWNGSTEAANATHLSLPLLSKADSVRLAIIDPDPTVHGSNPGDDIALMLSRHGIDATVDKIPSEGRDAGHALLTLAADKKAGLLVMGAYGHSRLREWLLGGATRTILTDANIPVLLAH